MAEMSTEALKTMKDELFADLLASAEEMVRIERVKKRLNQSTSILLAKSM